MRLALLKHYTMRAVWAAMPPAARRAATAIRLARRKPRIFN